MTTLTYDTLKTDKMRLLELEFGEDIWELIAEGPVRKAAARLGVSFSSISRWRQILLAASSEN